MGVFYFEAYTYDMKRALMRRIHSSWLIALLGASIFFGIWLAQYFNQYGSTWWFVLACCLVATGFILRRVWIIPIVVIGGMVGGLWRGSDTQTSLLAAKDYVGKAITVQGVVADDADSDKQGNTVLRLKNSVVNGKEAEISVWVVLSKNATVERSDNVIVNGKASDGFGTFAFSMYRANLMRVERPEPGDVALHIRNWFAGFVRTAIPEPESSLGLGYLVGQRRNLPADLDAALKIAGLTHIVVASGYNLTILVRLARRLFMKISRYTATLCSSGLIVGFILVTGFSPSMSRAGLVAGISLAAWYYGRKVHPVVLLFFAIGVTAFINPSYAWGDIGWQLSFAAFAGVMILAPLLQAYYFGAKKPGILRQILGETIAATIMTAPILILNFGYISNIAIVANLLVLPFVSLAMLLTAIAGIGAMAIPGIATLIGLPATLLLQYMIEVTKWCANLPWAVSDITLSSFQVMILYGVILLFMAYLLRKTKLVLRDNNLVE